MFSQGQPVAAVCLLPWRRNRLVSLYDMIMYPVGVLHRLLESLEEHARACEAPLAQQTIDSVQKLLNITERHCRDIEMTQPPGPIDRIEGIRIALKTGWTPFNPQTDLAKELRVLKEVIETGLGFTRFLFMPAGKFKFWEQPQTWFNESAWNRFESAREDMKRAVNAYATDDPTACVFYSMRIAERGLRDLAKHMRVPLKGRHIEYQDWGSLLKKLDDKLKLLLGKTRGPKRAERTKFYQDAKDKCAYFNDLYRQDVAHARAPYKDLAALNALTQVRDFMDNLATGLPKRKR